MADYELSGDLFVLPTAAGAYFAVSDPEDDPIRRLLLALLLHRSSPKADTAALRTWTGTHDEQAALEILHRAQTLAWVEGFPEAVDLPGLGIGQELHQLLPDLSSSGKGLVVDWNGLPLASCGLDEDTADALCALSADLIGVQERHSERLTRLMGLANHGWAATDAYGSSRIGAWPVYIGEHRLMLVLLGEPRLNRPAFLALVWLLINRYG